MGEATKSEEGKKEAATAPEKESTVKAEEGKKDDGGVGGDSEKKEGDGKKKVDAAPPPPPPEEIVFRVFMHCEGCAKKVKRSLKGFDGVEEVITDCRTHKVVVKGKKAAADPLAVVARVQKKVGRKVELLTPLPPPKPEKKEEVKEEKPKAEEKRQEPQVIAVILKVYMHCEACAQEIKKRILKMEGVQSMEPDLKASEVTVKGIFDPAKLVEYVYKRTGKHSVVVKLELVEKATEDEKKAVDGSVGDAKDEKKDEGGDTAKAEKKDDRAGGEAAKDEKTGAGEEGAEAAAKVAELVRNGLHYYYPRYGMGYAFPPPNAYPIQNPYPLNPYSPLYPYPPQMFSDENPNACSVM